MGSIYRRGNVWWVKYYRQGIDGRSRAVYESSRTSDLSAARDLLRQREGERAAGAGAPRVTASRATVADLVRAVIEHLDTEGRQALSVRRSLQRHLEPALGRARLAAVGELWPRYVEARRQAGAAAATINRERAALLLGYRVLGYQRPRLARLREAAPRQGFIEREELERICSYLDPPTADAVRFLWITGWRRSEVFGLEAGYSPLSWSQVTEDGVMLSRTKNGSPRHFPMTAELAALLARCRARQEGAPSPWVFSRPDGRPVKNCYRSWRRACKLAGCPGRLLHDCRRSAVRRFERLGIPRSVAMALTGHRTEAMHRRYCVVGQADFRAAVTALDAQAAH